MFASAWQVRTPCSQGPNQGIRTNLPTLKALLHLADTQNLIDDFDMRRVLETTLSVASDLLQLIGSDGLVAQFANDVKQKLNAI